MPFVVVSLVVAAIFLDPLLRSAQGILFCKTWIVSEAFYVSFIPFFTLDVFLFFFFFYALLLPLAL